MTLAEEMKKLSFSALDEQAHKKMLADCIEQIKGCARVGKRSIKFDYPLTVNGCPIQQIYWDKLTEELRKEGFKATWLKSQSTGKFFAEISW